MDAVTALADTITTDVTVESLLLDLLEWIGPTSRPYADVMDAWRTSCPRLPVWEEANRRGLVVRHHPPASCELVSVSSAGAAHLDAHGRGRA
jgi:hypothetical protein